MEVLKIAHETHFSGLSERRSPLKNGVFSFSMESRKAIFQHAHDGKPAEIFMRTLFINRGLEFGLLKPALPTLTLFEESFMYDAFLNPKFVGTYDDFEDSEVVIIGAPFDGTVTFRPGTRFAPQVMRIESVGLETYSPYQDRDLLDHKIHDMGDLNLPFGMVEKSLDMIEENIDKIVQSGKKPFMIGGEHLVTLPAFKAVHKKYPDICVIHFDAHTDLREDFLGMPLSHATVIRKIWDEIGDDRIFQFGIRSGGREEFYWADSGHTFLNKHDFTGLDMAIEKIGNRPVYFTLDLDVLDPSVMCGTGTTEGGGVTFKELMNAILSMKGLNVVATDIVELAPHYDTSGVSTAIACKLLREITLLIAKKN